jgi:hypothetical protein
MFLEEAPGLTHQILDLPEKSLYGQKLCNEEKKFLMLTQGENFTKLFSSSLIAQKNKLVCLCQAGFFTLVYS